MANKRVSGGLRTAQQLAKLLLYEVSNGNMGTKPEVIAENQTMTFGEKRGFLDSLIRIAELERRSAEGNEEESGFEAIRRNIDASRTSNNRGDGRRSAEGAADEPADAADSEASEELGS